MPRRDGAHLKGDEPGILEEMSSMTNLELDTLEDPLVR